MLLAFERNPCLFRRVVELRTHGPHYHVELAIEHSNLRSAWCFSSLGSWSGLMGVAKDGPRYAELDLTDPRRWDLVPLPPLAGAELHSMLHWCDRQVGKGYDYRALLGFVAKEFHEDPAKWICSEVVTHLVQTWWHALGEMDPSRTSPEELYRRSRRAFAGAS
jgi:hypothetical protein